ncbi:MAG: TlpA family protein disulfide reductase [Pyrinomonadaceae bacterium]
MNPEPKQLSPVQTQELPPQIMAALESAYKSRIEGNLEHAIQQLEAVLDETPGTADLMQYKSRVTLALAIADLCVVGGDSAKALRTLAAETNLAKATFKIIKAVGTDEEKRIAFRGLVQIRDVYTQLALTGCPAPELDVKEWIIGSPHTLAGLKGQVVLLEFWATWCKPCEAVFPKLKTLSETYASQGLVILALTRHFLAYGGSQDSQAEELQLIRDFVRKHAIDFPVGVSEDERMQSAYGATALPILVLIDRSGIVRQITVAPEDEQFKSALAQCLSASS